MDEVELAMRVTFSINLAKLERSSELSSAWHMDAGVVCSMDPGSSS